MSNFESPNFYSTFYYLEDQLLEKFQQLFASRFKVFINYKIESMSL